MELKKGLISTRWFPAYGFCAGLGKLSDNVFEDFDQQSEQLSGHDQSYLQLTPGAFRGRFLSAFLGGDVAIHMEFCNQALEQEVGGSPDHFSFGVTLAETDLFSVQGHQIGGRSVFVLPPSGRMHVISPPNGMVMAINIQRDLFLRQPSLMPPVLDWLDGLGQNVGVLHSGQLAHRIREDALAALEGVAERDPAIPEAMIGQALAASIASKLSLEWGGSGHEKGGASSPAYDRFQTCRHRLLSVDAWPHDSSEIASWVDVSKRSVEQAFHTNVSMGPLTYLRVLRLHDVKRKLAIPTLENRSIGDIAAEHGFWDWSRFSQQYRQHFGELPSATRQALSDQS